MVPVEFPPLTPVILFSFVNAIPTAELEPITETYVQGDEVRQLSPPRFTLLTWDSQGGYGNDVR